MAESSLDTLKAELIHDRVWRTPTQLELTIVEYVSWFNNDRLRQMLGDIPFAELETLAATRYVPTPSLTQ